MTTPRPPSTTSRPAWNAPQEEELAPAAMDNEMYVDGKVRVVGETLHSSKNQRMVDAPVQKSFFSTLAGGIRGLWATRMTENTEDNRELYVQTTLRELIVYLFYLTSLCILTFGMTSSTMFYFTNVLNNLFLNSQASGGVTFAQIGSVNDVWSILQGPLMQNGIYWETWYNGDNVTDTGYIFYENKLLGVPRLRQLKVKGDSCSVHPDFQKEIKECYDAYAPAIEDKASYYPASPSNLTAYKFYTAEELGSSNIEGLLATYSGDGYVQNLALTSSDSLAIVAELMQNRWLTRGTRVLFIDFTVYNANINLFCVIRLTVEFPPTGGAIPSWTFRTVKLLRYVTLSDYLVLGDEVIFILFVIYYCIEEVIEIRRHRLGYFKCFWNVLDIGVLVVSWICIVFNVYRYFKVQQMLDGLLAAPDAFPDFEFLSYWQMQFNNAVAITLFFSWIKVFKYISFNKTMTQLSSTLARCAKDLAGFAVMFFIIFFAFAQLGYLLFGTQVQDFSTFWNAVFALFRIILGDFNFQALQNAHRVLGPLYFLLYVFFVFFVLLNMFLAIINDTYSEVKDELADKENEFEMTDYFKKGYQKMMDKLNFKREAIIGIQNALQTADMDGDKKIDFDEWRRNLRNRGYADGEIEAVFAKYDQDGDRALDDEEQRRMMMDLEGQKEQLKKELDDASDRPKSSMSQLDDEDDSDQNHRRRRHAASAGVSYEEFTVLSRRVDRMEHSIGSIVSKIDAVLVKLEAMEKAKLKRRECMGKLLDKITEGDNLNDETKRRQMEAMVRDELEKWDTEFGDTARSSTARSDRTPRPGSGVTPAPYSHFDSPVSSMQMSSDNRQQQVTTGSTSNRS